MAQIPHNKGSFRQRNSGTWQIRYPLGWNDETKRYEAYQEDFESEAEAVSVLKEINDFVYHGGNRANISEYRRNARRKDAKHIPTVREFAETYCELRAGQMVVSNRTVRTDRECLSRTIPYIGKKRLDQVTSLSIDKMYAEMRTGGKLNPRGKPYSGTTLRRTHSVLSCMFNKAIDYGFITVNPCDKATIPKNDTPEKSALTPRQAQELFDLIASEPPAALPMGVLLALMCGFRLSEVLALTWDDYDRGLFDVRRSLEKNSQRTKSTKNGEERIVPCPPPLVPLLESWRESQQEWCDEVGLKWSTGMPIVSSSKGNHVQQARFDRWFAQERKRYPVPEGFGFHGLRHTYVTFLSRDCGMDERTTRDLSGHKSLQAYSVYTHTNDEWKREAARRIGTLVAPNGNETQCRNCRQWTESPDDATRGACWAKECNGAGLVVTECAKLCDLDEFVMRAAG
ncbi:MAG: tyrosine-type recombinase/integrase [Eggerthellaceae bacterium]|jgi:integrase